MTNHPETTYFSSIYNEPHPIGNLGDATSYSVMRAVEWLDECLLPLKFPKVHDFALIWHGIPDHDLIQIAETIYMNGLLSPVQFIGTRENTVSILISSKFQNTCGDVEVENLETKIQKACHETIGCCKEFHLGAFDHYPEWPTHPTELAAIIPANEYRASTYLRNIDNLWQLELKPFTPTPRPIFF